MYVTIPRNEELLTQMEEAGYDILDEKKNEKTHIQYFLDCEVYEHLPTMSDYETFKIDFEKSVKLEGLVTDKELQKIKRMEEGSTIYRIMNVQHAAAYYFEVGETDWDDRLDESDWFVTLYLHKEETENFIKENIRIFL